MTPRHCLLGLEIHLPRAWMSRQAMSRLLLRRAQMIAILILTVAASECRAGWFGRKKQAAEPFILDDRVLQDPAGELVAS